MPPTLSPSDVDMLALVARVGSVLTIMDIRGQHGVAHVLALADAGLVEIDGNEADVSMQGIVALADEELRDCPAGVTPSFIAEAYGFVPSDVALALRALVKRKRAVQTSASRFVAFPQAA